jgi:hypothetical protein
VPVRNIKPHIVKWSLPEMGRLYTDERVMGMDE